ncbi:MAG: hypothetical protein HYV28_16050 [Ignavibacteriales bacterium]|nr:hypothetical protein [Ignavibacteriales bacterium]
MDKSHFKLPEKFPAKEIFFLFFAIVIWLIFRTPLNDFFAKNILSVLFPRELQTSARVGLYILIVLVPLLFMYLNHRQYSIQFSTLIKLFPLVAFYFIERTCFEDFIFFRLFDAFPVAFADIFLVEIVACGLRLLKTKTTTKEEKDWNCAEAIRNILHDDLQRYPIAAELAKTVHERKKNCTEAIAVGVIGQWGSGKSSFLFLIKEAIKQLEQKKTPVIIDFNPWLVDGESDIIQDFFRTLRFELGKYSGAFSSSINKYVRLISKATKNQYLESIVDFFDTNEEPAGNAKMELNNLVKDINHDIYIFIDDIDRLTPNEILQVLKIIRSTGSFSNITYFVAFDKGYVSASLDGLKIHEPIFYLEKIFPSQRQLPAIGSKKIRKRMVEAFQESALPPAFLEEVTHLIEGKPSIEDDFIDVYIRTFRDVHILVNTFANHISNLKDDVNFRDFLFVTTLYVKNKKLFELLKDNKERIFGTDETRHRLTIPENLEELEKLCKDNGVNLDARIQQSLNFLFPRGGFLEHNKRENRLEQYANQEPLKFKDPFTISDTSYYTRYFELNLDTYDLSLEKYYEIQNKTFEENKIEITNLLNHGTLVGFFERIQENDMVTGGDRKIDFLKTYIFALLQLSKFPYRKSVFLVTKRAIEEAHGLIDVEEFTILLGEVFAAGSFDNLSKLETLNLFLNNPEGEIGFIYREAIVSDIFVILEIEVRAAKRVLSKELFEKFDLCALGYGDSIQHHQVAKTLLRDLANIHLNFKTMISYFCEEKSGFYNIKSPFYEIFRTTPAQDKSQILKDEIYALAMDLDKRQPDGRQYSEVVTLLRTIERNRELIGGNNFILYSTGG